MVPVSFRFIGKLFVNTVCDILFHIWLHSYTFDLFVIYLLSFKYIFIIYNHYIDIIMILIIII